MALPFNPVLVRVRGEGDETTKHRSEREAKDNDGHGSGIHSHAVGAINEPLEAGMATCTHSEPPMSPRTRGPASERASVENVEGAEQAASPEGGV